MASISAPRTEGHPRLCVMGLPITDLGLEEALAVLRACSAHDGGFAVFVNAHTMVDSHKDAELREALLAARYAFADGKPVQALARLLGARAIGRVPGPVLMDRALRDPEIRRRRHFFLGGTSQTLARLQLRYGGANIVGTFSPPFRDWTDWECEGFCKRVRGTGPDYVWVGLGAPKQEKWLLRWGHALGSALALGVGAAFRRNAGQLAPPPRWMEGMGLEWLHRLSQEPRRLGPRYARTNPIFLARAAVEVMRHVRVTLGGR